MSDKAHRLTDEMLEAMERHLALIYHRAQSETGKAWREYMAQTGLEIESLQKAYEKAKLSGDQKATKKAAIELSKAKRERTLQNRRFRALTDQFTAELANVNRTAAAYINGRLPDIYALNYNAFDGLVSGYSFTLTDADTVRRLAMDDPDFLPNKTINARKDTTWNRRAIRSEILQGILQGKNMDKIADSIMDAAEIRNRSAAIRTARTCVTGAENKGRLDSYQRAEADGVILKKKWVSTLDGRTRHTHRNAPEGVGGETRPQDEPFSNGLMFPGDRNGPDAETANCRCTMVAVIEGFKSNLPEDKRGAIKVRRL